MVASRRRARRLVYKRGDTWEPVVARGAYGVNRDTFNRVEFEPITTTAVRIEVEPKTVHCKTGEIGPPAAMFLTAPAARREFGIVEWRIR